MEDQNLQEHTADNPFRAPQASLTVESEPQHEGPRVYGGIGRLLYFFLSLGIWIAWVFGMNVLDDSAMGFGPWAVGIMLSAFFSFPFLMLLPTFFRLRNIGMQPWWCLLMLVPIANLLVGTRCLLCPRGYQHTRKFDLPAKILIGLFLILLLLLLILFMAALFMGPY